MIERPGAPQLGLAANWRQFSLLVVVNGFVGAMIGLERSVVPVLGAREFGITSATKILSFIAAFGFAKAFTNLVSGWLADRGVRKRTLVAGWLVALPVPFVILAALNWWWVVAANALLGINQGLAWSMTVIMKTDLAGPRRRGLATGLNEFAGYLALALTAGLSGMAASHYGARAGIAYPGMAIAVAGLLLSLVVRDTSEHVRLETMSQAGELAESRPRLGAMLRKSLWKDRALFSISQAGLVNNLNDGLGWGLFPILLASRGVPLDRAGILLGIYPAVWGVCQLATGPLSDRVGRKAPIVTGMIVQGIALVGMARSGTVTAWVMALTALGVGTALVYPTLIAAVGDSAHPTGRGVAIGVYRLWRDLGYVAGALLVGVVADAFSTSAAMVVVGLLTALSGLVVAVRLPEPIHRTGSV